MKLAVIGKDVSQSLSPAMHTFLFSRFGAPCSYDAVSIAPERFAERAEEFFERYDAFNVTIPFKTDVIPFLKELRGDARVFGAVNTVLVKERAGYNTDGYGFLLMLENAGVEIEGKRVLVLGAGGAGRSCVKKLLDAGAVVSVYERFEERLQAVYREFGSFTPLKEIPIVPYDIVINCTGIGMHDTVGVSPVGRELLSLCDTAVDLIYVPARSKFLEIAQQEGKRTVNGDSMLFYQGYMADCIILGKKPDGAQAKAFYQSFREAQS